MKQSTISRLLDLNHQFYQTFGAEFSATRQRLQPGVLCLLERVGTSWHILDLGCGNGELARELERRQFNGSYLGVDSSLPLLNAAGYKPHHSTDGEGKDLREGFTPQFRFANLASSAWSMELGKECYDAVFAFAVLHHLPSDDLRTQVLQVVRDHLNPGGLFCHSNWQFMNSPRLRERILPWSQIDLQDSDLEPGDALLDWRRGGRGLRYVHHFSPPELCGLALKTGFEIMETFYSDGQGGRLGLYQIWRAV